MAKEETKTAPQTFTLAEVQEMVAKSSAAAAAEAVRAVLEQLAPKPEKRLTAAEAFEQYKKDLKYSGPAKPEKRIMCASPITGSTFVAVVSPSTKYPEGRVVNLEHYKRPADAEIYEASGGRLPNGVPLRNGAGTGPSDQLKQYLYEAYWKADLQAYSGKPVRVLTVGAAAVAQQPAEEIAPEILGERGTSDLADDLTATPTHAASTTRDGIVVGPGFARLGELAGE